MCSSCVVALTSGTYKLVGTICAYSIVHSGPLPTFFSKPLYKAITEGYSAAKPGIADVSDATLAQQLTQVISFMFLLSRSKKSAMMVQ